MTRQVCTTVGVFYLNLKIDAGTQYFVGYSRKARLSLAINICVFLASLSQIRPIESTESFNATQEQLEECRRINLTAEQCESAITLEDRRLYEESVVSEPFWYNPIALGIVTGIVAVIGYGIFSVVKYLRRKK